jgi:hypothetical protein
MLLNSRTDPPEQPPSTRRQQLKYLDRFNRWARKLTDDDLGMVVAFCANVHMAWNDGQQKAPTTAEQVEQGTAPIAAPPGLPGLGGDNAPD